MARATTDAKRRPPVLSVIVPAFNEERSLVRCLERVLAIAGPDLALEIIVVDDASTDRTKTLAEEMARRHPSVRVAGHARNRGKGAALHTGFRLATGDFVAVQDADLEYDPRDLRRLMAPLLAGDADVVVGSRFLGSQPHRVLYFWHSVGNRVLTLLSNMFTDLNLTDMETCYKVFRRDLLQHLDLREERFGFEPEVVAQLARLRPRIYEMGISYVGRTYAEGKKIGMRDGFRALYCIARYNLPHAPLPVQAAGYVFVGGLAALANLGTFVLARQFASDWTAAPLAFVAAAVVNYVLCVTLLFRRRANRTRLGELAAYTALVAGVGAIDASATVGLIAAAWPPALAKATASLLGLLFNFLGRRDVVFARPPVLTWAPADPHTPAPRSPAPAAVQALTNASPETR